MPLFEIETDSHIIITWAADEPADVKLSYSAIRRTVSFG